MKRYILLIYGMLIFCAVFAQQTECVNALAQVKQDSLVHFIDVLTGRASFNNSGQAALIESRYATHPGNNLAADYIKQSVIAYGFNVQDIPFSLTGRNIVAFKEGTESTKQAYLLGAHYDCVGNATMRFQGADDNASGAATLLEAARVLQTVTFPYTIILAFWDEEENGLLGSKAFAPDGPLGFWDVKASVNLDMIGYDGNHDSLAMIHTFPVGTSELLATRLLEINREYHTGLHTTVKNPGDKSTDHQSFWNAGATSIGLTEDYDHDFNPHWHLWSDSIENMHLPYYTQMSKLAIASLCDFGKTGKTTGVRETKSLNFLMYPNPVCDHLVISPSETIEAATLRILDITGKPQLELVITSNGINVDMTGFPAGYYLLEITAEQGRSVKPVLKLN